MKITTSKKFSINWQDVLKGLVIAVVTGIIATCGQVFESWLNSPTFTIDRVSIVLVLKAAIGAGAAYLFKNFFSPSKTIIKNEDPKTE